MSRALFASVFLGMIASSAVGGTPAAVMRDVVAARLSQLDRLALDIVFDLWLAPAGASPLDTSQWFRANPDGTSTFPHYVLIARPNILDFDMIDAPEDGYVPVFHSITDGQYVSRQENPYRAAYLFHQSHSIRIVSPYCYMHLLQVLDYDILNAPVEGLNTLRLFDEYRAELVDNSGEASTYRASVQSDGMTCDLEFTLNGRGTPLWLRSTLNPGEGRPVTVREQFTLIESPWGNCKVRIGPCIGSTWGSISGCDQLCWVLLQ